MWDHSEVWDMRNINSSRNQTHLFDHSYTAPRRETSRRSCKRHKWGCQVRASHGNASEQESWSGQDARKSHRGDGIALPCRELVEWIIGVDKDSKTANLPPQKALWHLEGCQRNKTLKRAEYPEGAEWQSEENESPKTYYLSRTILLKVHGPSEC